MREKLADLLDTVNLQEHQQRLADEASRAPMRKLLVHALGSGKTLTSIAAAERYGQPYTAVTPAALRPNFEKEQERFTDQSIPSEVLSYSQLARGHKPTQLGSLILDEAHRIRNPNTQSSRNIQQAAARAKQLIMLSGTPIVNEPSDLATPLSMLTNRQITPQEFTSRYVVQRRVQPGFFARMFQGAKPKTETGINHENELRALLKGHVDWYAPERSAVPIQREDVPVEMGPEQTQLYKAMWNQLPFTVRWKMKNDYALSDEELQKATSFLTGPRQVALSTYPYLPTKDPLKAYAQSTKLQKAHSELQKHLQDPRFKALVFSNFIDAGLTPYAAALQKANIPHAVFHGGLNDAQRRRLVDEYNAGKLRVALLGPSGTEGLSFRGTQLIQLLDPYWNPVRGKQSEGRGLRFDSHTDLPPELQNVKIQRYLARLPLGTKDRILAGLGANREQHQHATDDYLVAMARRKEQLNQRFMDLLKEVGTQR